MANEQLDELEYPAQAAEVVSLTGGTTPLVESEPVNLLSNLDASSDEDRAKFASSFDVKRATKAGMTDHQMVLAISEAFPNFDLEAAKKAGVTDRQIISRFAGTSEKGPTETIGTVLSKSAVKAIPAVAAAGPAAAIGFSVAGPPGAMVFGAGSLLASMPVGEWLSGLFYPDETYPPSVSPYATGAETAGYGMLFANLPYFYESVAANSGAAISSKINKLIGRQDKTPLDQIILNAIEKPKRYLFGEAGSATTAGMGGYYAEQLKPGSESFRIALETAGGFLSPTTWAMKGVDSIASIVSKPARERRAGRALHSWLLENKPKDIKIDGKEITGEQYVRGLLEKLSNPDNVTQLALKMGIPEDQIPKLLTAAHLDDPLIRGLQSRMAQDKKEGARIRQLLQQDYGGMTNLLGLMMGSGDPQLVARAIIMRKNFMEGVIARRLDEANAEANEVARTILRIDDPRASMKANQAVENSLDRANKDLRKHENKLYEAIDGSEAVQLQSFIKQYEQTLKEMDSFTVSMPKAFKNLYHKARGESLQQVEQRDRTMSRLDQRIQNAQEWLSKERASRPKIIEEALSLGRVAEDSVGEDRLSQIQSAIKIIEGGYIPGLKKNKYKTILEKEAQILDATLEKQRLSQTPLETGIEPEMLTVEDLRSARTTALNMARGLVSDGTKFNEARMISDIADSLVDDLGIAAGGRDADLSTLTPNQVAMRTAADFSKSYHDVVDRAIPSVILKRNRQGARAIMPEVNSAAIFRGGSDATALKYDQLERALDFTAKTLGETSVGSAQQIAAAQGKMIENPLYEAFTPDVLEAFDRAGRVGTTRAAYDAILRAMAQKDIMGADNKVDPKKLSDFMQKNRNIFFSESGEARFPDLVADLSNAETANNALRVIQDRKSYFETKLRNSDLTQTALRYPGNPQKLISTTIGEPGNPANSSEPENLLRRMARRVKVFDEQRAAAGQETGAVQGLKDMIFDAAFKHAEGQINKQTGKPTDFSFGHFSDYLRRPIVRGGRSPVEILRQEGILSEAEVGRFLEFVKEGVKSQASKALADTPVPTEPGNLVTRQFDKFVRLMGLRAGRQVTRAMPGQGQGLAEPGMISEEFEILARVPRVFHRDLILKAIEDKDFFQQLLQKGVDAEPLGAKRRFNAWLLANGFVSEDDVREDEARRQGQRTETRKFESEGTRPAIRRSTETPTVSPPPVRVQPQAKPPIQTQQRVSPAPPPVAQAPAPASNPMDRARLAAAFPNDPILKLMG